MDRSGVIAGFLVGFAIYAFLDWRGYLLLLAFFVIGSAATKLGYRKKAAAKLAQEKGGRRGSPPRPRQRRGRHRLRPVRRRDRHPVLFALAFAGAFATAAADTASCEIGQLLGRRTFLITTFRPVPRGTEGAVSLEGTLAGILASLVIAALGAALGLYPWQGVLRRRGRRLPRHHVRERGGRGPRKAPAPRQRSAQLPQHPGGGPGRRGLCSPGSLRGIVKLPHEPDPQSQVKRTVRGAAETLTSPALLSHPHTHPCRERRETEKDLLKPLFSRKGGSADGRRGVGVMRDWLRRRQLQSPRMRLGQAKVSPKFL